MLVRRAVPFALLLLCASARPTPAAWTHDPLVNLPVCTAAGNQQYPTIVSDGAGGAIVTWQDARVSTTDIYAEHVLASGTVDPAWPVNGCAVCTASGYQSAPVLVSDGSGGAIVTWNDSRGASYDIYAQHVLAGGVVDPAWPVNGRAICTAANSQNSPTIVSDGAGGAFITWQDYRVNGADIYAQHVLASGAVDPAWPVDGRALCTLADEQNGPMIVSDGAGGAVVTWTDYRSGASNADIYAQHVLASGAVDPAWPVDGTALCTAATNQLLTGVVSDGAGGAFAIWQDARSAVDWDVYAQHVSSNGSSGWTPDGVIVCSAAGHQTNPRIVTDGTGGAIATWQDHRRGLDYDIYAQHVRAGGSMDPAWPLGGRALCTATYDQSSPAIVPDGAGGAIVSWQDYRGSADADIYAQHVQASGAVDPTWPADGQGICLAEKDQVSPMMVPDDGALGGVGSGAIIAWHDIRNGTNYDIYAQRVARFGYLGSPEPAITGVHDVPNDQGGKVKVSWTASYLDLDADPNLAAYDLYRSVPPNVALAAIARGATRLSRLGETTAAGTRAFYLGPAAATDYAWEYVATQVATHAFASYSFVAPTTSDSLPGSNPKTAFVILARNGSGSVFWLSPADSGYSADNLAPAMPVPFTGQYAAGSSTLQWRAPADPDLADYRLYRGTDPAFAPGPGNLVATLTGTGFVDHAGSPAFYRLSAVDVHGNEGPCAFLQPDGTVGVEEGAPAREVRFAPPAPNPAHGGVTLAFALPRPARVTLGIYDGAGRLVRTLAAGTLDVGEHGAAWDLRDERGHAVGAGLYFARLDVAGRTLTRRLAVTP